MVEGGQCDRKALVVVKEMVETTLSAHLLAEKKLKVAKREVDDLSTTLDCREAFFARIGVKISTYLSKSLGRVGAHVPPFEVAEGENVERGFFD